MFKPYPEVKIKGKTASPIVKQEKNLEHFLRFPQGMLAKLRGALLADLSREHFAILLASREIAPNGRKVFVVREAMLASDADLLSSSLAQVRPSKEFIAHALSKARTDLRVNAIIDVHTHPFSQQAFFSGVDDADERRFSQWLNGFDPKMGYASLLFSAKAWEARIWEQGTPMPLTLKTQTLLESIPHITPKAEEISTPEMQSRTALALGVDVLRRIAADQRIVLAGVGGLGSVIAEQLVRSGFTRIGLIDADTLEVTNLNRFAGGYLENVGQLKVEVTKNHLKRINPEVDVIALACGVEEPKAESLLAAADWIILSTDSHSSRQSVQQTALRYGVPLISAGVSITVAKEGNRHKIVDQSGEVIVVRYGDEFCLHCLGRINPYKVAAETNPDAAVRKGLVEKGYVQGLKEKEPAVMPLNATIASITTQTLLDQYRDDAVQQPIIVYESHAGSCC